MISSHRYLITTIFFPFFHLRFRGVFEGEFLIINSRKALRGFEAEIGDGQQNLFYKFSTQGSVGARTSIQKKYDLFLRVARGCLCCFSSSFSVSARLMEKNFVLTRGRNKKI
jgi:hypothetical protein